MRDDLPLYLGRPLDYIHVEPNLLRGRPNAYAVTIEGDCLAPTFRDGDLIIVDPDKKPAPGDYVILRKKGWQAHAAMLLESGTSPKVRDHHNGTYRAPGETVLGVIVCAVRPEACAGVV